MKAFPIVVPDVDKNYSIQSGMELRDYFAAKAMQSLLNNWHEDPDWDAYEHADIAYKIADVMMKAREQ